MKQLYKTNQELLNTARQRKELNRITIFLERDDYIKLNNIKYKYHLSISTIAQIIYNFYLLSPIITDACINNHYYNTGKTCRKTTIKVNNKLMENESLNKTQFFNNALIIFIRDKTKDLLNTKDHEKVKNKIYACLQNTVDPFYDYNEFYRKYHYLKQHD